MSEPGEVDIPMDDEEAGGGGAPRWMVTFGDMMSLLLCFFVLLLSYSTMDIHKFQMVLQSLRVGFGQLSSTALVQPAVPRFGDDVKDRSDVDEKSLFLAMRMEEIVDQADLSSAVEMTREEAGILLRVRGQVLFRPGSADILPESLAFLSQMAKLLREFPHQVLVRGHTDDLPVPPSSPFPSNWELSSARAAAVVRTLISEGRLSPSRFAAVGYADTKPLERGTSEESRAMNRRVEFLLVNQTSPTAREGVTIF